MLPLKWGLMRLSKYLFVLTFFFTVVREVRAVTALPHLTVLKVRYAGTENVFRALPETLEIQVIQETSAIRETQGTVVTAEIQVTVGTLVTAGIQVTAATPQMMMKQLSILIILTLTMKRIMKQQTSQRMKFQILMLMNQLMKQ